jgi:hypothetical protein
MMQSQFIQKIEIGFWNQAIPLMTSSKPVQKLIRDAYQLSRDRNLVRWIPAILICSAGFGLGLGYFIGTAGMILK